MTKLLTIEYYNKDTFVVKGVDRISMLSHYTTFQKLEGSIILIPNENESAWLFPNSQKKLVQKYIFSVNKIINSYNLPKCNSLFIKKKLLTIKNDVDNIYVYCPDTFQKNHIHNFKRMGVQNVSFIPRYKRGYTLFKFSKSKKNQIEKYVKTFNNFTIGMSNITKIVTNFNKNKNKNKNKNIKLSENQDIGPPRKKRKITQTSYRFKTESSLILYSLAFTATLFIFFFGSTTTEVVTSNLSKISFGWFIRGSKIYSDNIQNISGYLWGNIRRYFDSFGYF